VLCAVVDGVECRAPACRSNPSRGQSAPHSATTANTAASNASNVAMLGVGAGLAAALGLRNAKYTYDEPVPATGRSAAPTSSQPAAKVPEARPSFAGGHGGSSVATSAPAFKPPAAAATPMFAMGQSRGRVMGIPINVPADADGDDVEAALKAQAKRAASAGPSGPSHNTWMLPSAATTGTGAYGAVTPAAAEPASTATHSHSRARSAAPSSKAPAPAAKPNAAEDDSTESAGVMGEEDSSDGVKATGDTAKTVVKGMPVNAATASSVTAGSTPGGGDAPVSTAHMTEEELRQYHREREYQQRQRLKAFVASHEFDGKSNTDFYGFGKVLGQGSFGKVRLAWHRLAGAKVAIKSYEKAKLTEPNHWRRVQQEIRCPAGFLAAVRLCPCFLPVPRVSCVLQLDGTAESSQLDSNAGND
jgi:hypothetical protein